MTSSSRQPAGIPAGGQFASRRTAEPSAPLDTPGSPDDWESEPADPGSPADLVRQLEDLYQTVATVEAEEAEALRRYETAAEDLQAAKDRLAALRASADRLLEAIRGTFRGSPVDDMKLVDGKEVFSAGGPTVQSGQVVNRIETADGTVFHRRRQGVYPNWPSHIRIQGNRPLTDGEVRQAAQLTGYAFRAALHGDEPVAHPERDSPYSFIVRADSSSSRSDDIVAAFDEFEQQLPTTLTEGSPVRKTDRQGPRTAGTRLVEGLGAGLTFEVFYDEVTGD